MLPKKLPSTRNFPPERIFTAMKSARSESEEKSATKACKARAVSTLILEKTSRATEPKSMKPKVPTSKL